jgi:hypothetical protein
MMIAVDDGRRSRKARTQKESALSYVRFFSEILADIQLDRALDPRPFSQSALPLVTH